MHAPVLISRRRVQDRKFFVQLTL